MCKSHEGDVEAEENKGKRLSNESENVILEAGRQREEGLRNRSNLEQTNKQKNIFAFQNWEIYEYSTGTVPILARNFMVE
jgi:hypothetical protein